MDMIRRHAQLSCAVQHHVATGRRPPASMIQEIQRIESKAQATLAGPQLSQAMRASQALQAQMFQTRDAQSALRVAKDKNFFHNHAAKKATGFDAGQLQQIAKTGKVTERPKFHAGRAKEQVLGIARQFKQDISLGQWEKLAERVNEMNAHGKDPSDYLKGKFGGKAGSALQALNAFNESGIEIAYRLAKDDDVTRDLTKDEASELQMKLVAAEKDPQGLYEPIDQSYLENEGCQGDVARAMEKVEFEEMAQERENHV